MDSTWKEGMVGTLLNAVMQLRVRFLKIPSWLMILLLRFISTHQNQIKPFNWKSAQPEQLHWPFTDVLLLCVCSSSLPSTPPTASLLSCTWNMSLHLGFLMAFPLTMEYKLNSLPWFIKRAIIWPLLCTHTILLITWVCVSLAYIPTSPEFPEPQCFSLFPHHLQLFPLHLVPCICLAHSFFNSNSLSIHSSNFGKILMQFFLFIP